ncbi:MAG: hypothetical protein JWM14_1026 [Chitinophagaceae bacterium]|nr:hypothetical protein [Chitinophagaceae bacterium]
MKTTSFSKKSLCILGTVLGIAFSNSAQAQWTTAPSPADVTVNQKAVIGVSSASSTVTVPTTKVVIQEDNPVLEIKDNTATDNRTNSVGINLTTSVASYQLSTYYSSAMGPTLSLKNSTGVGYHFIGNNLWLGMIGNGSSNTITLGGPVNIINGATINSMPLYVNNASLSMMNSKIMLGTSNQWAIGAQVDGITHLRIGKYTGTTFAEYFRIFDNGAVKIGTTSYTGTTHADYKLSIDGKVIAPSFYALNPTNWADYVFEKDYKLTSLEDIETYVKQNKHLPEVPTTKDVAENGIDMVQMEVLLLKKVEELTLHMIEMKKSLNQLELENAELRNRINTSSK